MYFNDLPEIKEKDDLIDEFEEKISINMRKKSKNSEVDIECLRS
jgi:hypothetical protein